MLKIGLGLEFDIGHSLDTGPKLQVLPVTGPHELHLSPTGIVPRLHALFCCSTFVIEQARCQQVRGSSPSSEGIRIISKFNIVRLAVPQSTRKTSLLSTTGVSKEIHEVNQNRFIA